MKIIKVSKNIFHYDDDNEELFTFANDGDDQKDILGRRLHEIDAEKAYEIFKSSYEKATGEAFDKQTFLNRASNWKFYGDENGFITVRDQRSGRVKLTGMAGDLRSILEGLKDLMKDTDEKPVWGLVTKDIASMAKKKGLMSPPGWVIKHVVKLLPSSVLGGANIQEITDDGGLVVQHPKLKGTAVKYLVGNKAYYKSLLSLPDIPMIVKTFLKVFTK